MIAIAPVKPSIAFQRNALQVTSRSSSSCLRTSSRKTMFKVSADASEAKSTGIETTGPNMKPLKEIQEIMEILPHR